MALHAPNMLLSQLDPALRTHPRGHLGGTVTLHLHKAPMELPQCMRPWTEPSICLHDLPLLAAISSAIVATDAGTT